MSSFDRLVTMISEKNVPTYPLTHDNIAFGNPVVDHEYEWNTRLNVHGISNKGYRGIVEVFYTRVSMSALGTVIELMQEAPFTMDGILNTINVQKTAQITATDLSNPSLPMIENGVIANFQMSAALTSLVWLGNTQLRLLSGIPAEADHLANFLNSVAALPYV